MLGGDLDLFGKKTSSETEILRKLIALSVLIDNLEQKIEDVKQPAEPERNAIPAKRWWIPTCLGKIFEKGLYIFTKSFWDSLMERVWPK